MELDDIASSLDRFGIELEICQLEQLSRYLELLLLWNRSINLTAIRDPHEVVVRHFAESMYLKRFAELRGRLLDIGSGAGFPGLPLKIAAPHLSVILLEPVAKKRAFLKEVIRECGLNEVEVKADRIQEFAVGGTKFFDSVTMRAVGDFRGILPSAARCLAESGGLYLWLTRREAAELPRHEPAFDALYAWSQPIPIPLSRDREIWRGGLRTTP